MRKRFTYGFVIAALAAVFAIPGSGRAADLVPHIVSAECTGTATAPVHSTCSTTFELDKAGFVSNIDTHGNFHQLLAQNGGVSLTWTDAAGNVVFEATCISPGLYIDPLGTGPFDIQSFTCTNSTERDTYVEGTQTLTVLGWTDGCVNSPACTFHGKISISAPDSLL